MEKLNLVWGYFVHTKVMINKNINDFPNFPLSALGFIISVAGCSMEVFLVWCLGQRIDLTITILDNLKYMFWFVALL